MQADNDVKEVQATECMCSRILIAILLHLQEDKKPILRSGRQPFKFVAAETGNMAGLADHNGDNQSSVSSDALPSSPVLKVSLVQPCLLVQHLVLLVPIMCRTACTVSVVRVWR